MSRIPMSAWLIVVLSLFWAWACEEPTPPPQSVETPAAQEVRPSQVSGQKKISITIDDGPIVGYYTYPDAMQRAMAVDSMIAVLQRHRVPATLFVIGQEMHIPEQRDLLARWLDAGFALGNHSYSHSSFNEISLDEAAREIAETNRILRELGQPYGRSIQYFRFPFLEEGATLTNRRAIATLLQRNGLRNAPVTISNEDWRFNEQYKTQELAEEWEERYETGQAYLQHIREAIDHWEAEEAYLYNRRVGQVLVIHANRINRDYLEAIILEFQARQYRFVTLDEIYRDPAFQEETTWISDAAGTSFFEHVKQTRFLKEN